MHELNERAPFKQRNGVNSPARRYLTIEADRYPLLLGIRMLKPRLD